jgi:hypothetical protein
MPTNTIANNVTGADYNMREATKKSLIRIALVESCHSTLAHEVPSDNDGISPHARPSTFGCIPAVNCKTESDSRHW